MRTPGSLGGLLLIAGVIALASCEVSPPVGVDPGTRGSVGLTHLGVGLSLLRCSPLSADTATVTVGPAGATLTVGPHTLVIPAGALDSTVTITAIAPSDSLNRIEFAPEGLRFQQPASLTMSYANCNLLGITLPQLVYTSDALQILEILNSVNNLSAKTVTGGLSHFSNYAVAW